MPQGPCGLFPPFVGLDRA